MSLAPTGSAPCRPQDEGDDAIDQNEANERANGDCQERPHDPLPECFEMLQD
jgi:hypothetical protein